MGILCLSGCAQNTQTTPPAEEETQEEPISSSADAAPLALPSTLTQNADGSYTILLTVTEYISEARGEADTIRFAYDDFGNMTKVWGEYFSDYEIPSQLEQDDAGRPVSCKLGLYDDEYHYTYDADGTLLAIEGQMNFGELAFCFTRTTEGGAAYELKEFWPASTQVLRYDANYRLIERGSYAPDADPATYEASQRFAYDASGRLVRWDWLRYDDIAFTYTADDFDAMGHCRTQNSVALALKEDGSGETEPYVRTQEWSTQTETDAEGRVICDVHTYADDPETPYIITYSYTYDGDALTGFSYAVRYPSMGDDYLEYVYAPVTLHCDALQIAFLMIYGQDLPADLSNSTRGFSVDMPN